MRVSFNKTVELTYELDLDITNEDEYNQLLDNLSYDTQLAGQSSSWIRHVLEQFVENEATCGADDTSLCISIGERSWYNPEQCIEEILEMIRNDACKKPEDTETLKMFDDGGNVLTHE